MLYMATLALIQGGSVAALANKYGDLIGQALYYTVSDGTLDILIMKPPDSLYEVAKTVGELYEISRKQAEQVKRSMVSVRILLDGHDVDLGREQTWEVIMAGRAGE